MTLLIAFMIIAGLKLPGILYFVAAGVWVFKKTLSLAADARGRWDRHGDRTGNQRAHYCKHEGLTPPPEQEKAKMSEKIVNHLREMQAATDEILTGLNPKDIQEAINWADLSCDATYYRIDCDGVEDYDVLISEASPDCQKLPLYVAEELAKRGYEHVEVHCEW